MGPALQKEIVGRPVLGRFPLSLLGATHRNASLQGSSDGARHLVLDGKHILHAAVVALGPQMRFSRGIDELRCDAQSVAGPADTAFGDVANAPPCAARLPCPGFNCLISFAQMFSASLLAG